LPANINVILQAIAVVTNQLAANAPQIVNFDFGNPTMPSAGTGGTSSYYEPFFQAITSPTAVPFPGTKIFGIFILNQGSGNVTVSYLPTLGVSTSITLGPGGVFIYFNPSEAGQGVTGLSLTGVGGTQSCSVLVCE
jgi:hypothetical protein